MQLIIALQLGSRTFFACDSMQIALYAYKKAQLSMTNPRDAKACQKLLQFYVLTIVWSTFIRLAVVASEICEIPRNSLKIQTYRVQGHPRSSILVSIESAYAASYHTLTR